MAVTLDRPLNWAAIQTAPETADADAYNVDPFPARGAATIYTQTPGVNVCRIRMRRANDDTITVAPILLAYGQDASGEWQRLEFRPSNNTDGAYAGTCLCDDAKDLDDATYRYTKPIDVVVQPVEGFQVHILVAVEGADSPVIQRRLY